MIRRLPIAIMTVTLFHFPGLVATNANAKSLQEPKGPTILTVVGLLSNHNGGGKARFDIGMLQSLGTKRLHTRTCCSDTASDWKGVLMRSLLTHVGARGHRVTISALDGYQVEIPTEDFYKHDVLLAFEQDGKRLTVRTRGPLRLIYPHDHNSELHDPKYAARYVWQIRKIDVR